MTPVDPHTAHVPRKTMADASAPPDECDVLVVGAGIAGATAARLLAARGHKVVLVDRAEFPRYKVCGCCLNLRSIAALRRAGLLAGVEALSPSPLSVLELAAQGRRASVPLPGGLAVSRTALDEHLVREARKAGALFKDGTAAKIGPMVDNQFRTVSLACHPTAYQVRARVVLAADGLLGDAREKNTAATRTIASSSRVGIGTMFPGAPASIESGVIYMACSPGGYAGLVRVESGQVAIAAAVDPEYLRQSGGPAAAVESILASTPLPRLSGLRSLTWKGTPPMTQGPAALSENRLLVIGDSGGYVEPFTGEGMAWALASANAADRFLASGLEGDWTVRCRNWDRMRRRAMRRQRVLCHTVARVLRSPRATRLALSALSVSSIFSRPFLQVINAQSRS